MRITFTHQVWIVYWLLFRSCLVGIPDSSDWGLLWFSSLPSPIRQMLVLYFEIGCNSICNIEVHLINVTFLKNIAKGCVAADITVRLWSITLQAFTIASLGWNEMMYTRIRIYIHENKTGTPVENSRALQTMCLWCGKYMMLNDKIDFPLLETVTFLF